MKKISTRYLIPLVACAALLIGTLIITLSLSKCHYEEPDLSEYGVGSDDQTEQPRSPYGMFDFSKRAFLSDKAPYIYKNDVYFGGNLTRASLLDMTCDLRTATDPIPPSRTSVCPNTAHDHDSASAECPAYLGYGLMLIDAYESAGDFPIIYFTNDQYYDPKPGTELKWVSAYSIFRYDTGKLERQRLISVSDRITHMMTYDKWIFFITVTEAGDCSLSRINKDGKEAATLALGGDTFHMMDVYDDHIILRDSDATIYRLDFDLTACEALYQVEEDLQMAYGYFESVFIHDGYLYFCADFATVDYPISAHQSIPHIVHTVRRLPMDSLEGEGEVVAENIYEDAMYGISDNVFYYSPCEPGESLQGYSYNFSGGKLKGVDLDTLEPIGMTEDLGFAFVPGVSVHGDGIISEIVPLRDLNNIISEQKMLEYETDGLQGRRFTCIYDIRTGALYLWE